MACPREEGSISAPPVPFPGDGLPFPLWKRWLAARTRRQHSIPASSVTRKRNRRRRNRSSRERCADSGRGRPANAAKTRMEGRHEEKKQAAPTCSSLPTGTPWRRRTPGVSSGWASRRMFGFKLATKKIRRSFLVGMSCRKLQMSTINHIK